MRNKKFEIAVFTLLSMAFSACSLNEDIEESVYSSITDKSVVFRVADISATNGLNEGLSDFKLSVLNDTETYSAPMNVSSKGAVWLPDEDIFWPTGQATGWPGFTFIAFSENGDAFSMNGSSATFTDYTTDGKSDLLYAVSRNVYNEYQDNSVNLMFRHALSKVTFSVRNDNPAYEDIEIISVELTGVSGAGTYIFPQSSSVETGEWTLSEKKSSYTIDDINIHLGELSGRNVDLTNVLYLIPQNTKDAYVKVTARMTLRNCNGANFIKEELIPIDIEWQEGDSYNYNIIWNATPITFNVSVEDFQEISITYNH